MKKKIFYVVLSVLALLLVLLTLLVAIHIFTKDKKTYKNEIKKPVIIAEEVKPSKPLYNAKDQIPDIEEYFPDSELIKINVMKDGSKYCMRVNGYDESTYDLYIEACKAMGLEPVYEGTSNNLKITFLETPDAKYRVDVVMVNDVSMDILCSYKK